MQVEQERSVLIPEKYFFAKSMKFRRNLFPSRPIFSLNSVNGQPPGSKSDFFGTLTSGDESGEKLHSAITGSGISHKFQKESEKSDEDFLSSRTIFH